MQETKTKARDRQMVYYPPEDLFEWLKGATDRGAVITEALRAYQRAQRGIPEQCRFFSIDFTANAGGAVLVQGGSMRSPRLVDFVAAATGKAEYHVFYSRDASAYQIAIDVFARKAILELPSGAGLMCEWDAATRTALPLTNPGERWVFAESTVAHFYSFAGSVNYEVQRP